MTVSVRIPVILRGYPRGAAEVTAQTGTLREVSVIPAVAGGGSSRAAGQP